MLKSNQTSKYETHCFIQEQPQVSELDTRGFELLRSIKGEPYIRFPATLQTYDVTNRMGRRYDAQNVISVINNDERIQTLKRQNKWRGELNHPNPDIKGTQLSDIRMTIPEQTRTSHIISNDRLEGNRLKATITTHPETKCGQICTSEVVDLGGVPSFSVRVLGTLIPNAPSNQPNIRVSKFITADWVDFPSHQDADGDIRARIMECANVYNLAALAKYACNNSEKMQVVCESFMISPEEIVGMTQDASVVVEQASGTRMRIPLEGEIRREVVDFIRRGII